MTISAYLNDALHAIADSFTPLSTGLADADSFRAFLARFGWEFDPAVDDSQFAVVGQIFSVEKLLLEEFPDADAATLAVAIPALVTSMLRNRSPDPAWPTPLNSEAFWSGTPTDPAFPCELLDGLLYDIVADRVPIGLGLLRFVGVFDQEEHLAVPAAGNTPERTAYTRRAVAWNRLGPAISHPENIFETVYHWNGAGGAFEYTKLLRNIGALFEGFPLGVAVIPTSTAARELYFDPIPLSPVLLDQLTVLPLSYQTASGPTFGSMKLSLNALPIPPTGMRTGLPVGIAIFPLVSGQVQSSITLLEGITVTLSGAYATIPVLTEIRPTGVTFNVPQGTTGTLNAEARVDAHTGATPWLLLGSADATRLELSQAHLSIKAQGALTDPEFTIEVGLDSAAVVIDFSQGDSFLQSVFGDKAQRSDLALTIAWSNKTGFRVRGQARFEVNIPIHQTILGAITLDTIFVVIRADATGGIVLEAAVSGSFALGPIAVTVDRVGLTMGFEASNSGSGNLGIVNLNLGFRSPNGMGFVIDASAVVGGGYLFYDGDKGQYGGVLQLEVKGGIAIKAIGLITTKMPDGSPGFSLLIIITVEFSPIQLGYGFTLNGVGGLAGFNRTMNVDALRDGIKNRTLDSIMFPPDPIANAKKIISDLQTIFPPAPGRFVFAPMVKLGWGSGILLIEIGLVVELPSPLVLAIMGKLHLKLPPLKQGGDGGESKNIVEIHMDVLGILDFDRSEASVDAVLYDSRLVIFPITGGMAMRLRWGSNPVFIISIGGFNPRFTPPPVFPTLDRLGLQLSYDKNGLKARLRLESYFAVTPNTLQFGARIDVYAEVVGLATVTGFLGFDALIEFHPFYFIVDLYGGVSVEAFNLTFSVDLLLTLSGPNPFVGNGHATVNFLGKHEVPIHFTIGDEQPVAALPPVNPLEELTTALGDLRNWSAVLPTGSSMLVTLRQLSADEMKDKVLAHPLGELTVRQKVLPFDITLERFGASVPTTPGPFKISQFLFGTTTPTTVTPKLEYVLRDAFARGQFVNLSEDEKLSSPCFESFPCGQTRIGTDTIIHGTQTSAVFEYDVTIIDDKEAQSKRTSKKDKIPLVSISDVTFMRAAQSGAAKQTPMDSMGSAKFAGSAQGIKVSQPEYAIAGMDDMEMRGTNKFNTYTEAEAARPGGAAGEWQVVEAHEAI